MSKIAERHRFLGAEFTRRVEAVAADQWGNSTPCEGWDVRAVVEHVLGSYVHMPAQVDISLGLRKSVADDPVGAWVEARDALREVIEDPARATLEYDGYFGRTSLERTVDKFLGLDLLIHAWDIARATGQDETLPPGEVSEAYVDLLPNTDMLRTPGVCGPVVPVPSDASDQDKLLGFLGRTP